MSEINFEEPAPRPPEVEPKPDRTPEAPEVPLPLAPSMTIPRPTTKGMPPWVLLPEGFMFPRGKQLLFLRFKAAWTDAPWKGHTIAGPDGRPLMEVEWDPELDRAVERPILWRQCVCWPINVGDKKLALGRSINDPYRASDELCRQMIRVIDGEKVDWGTAGIVDVFWNEAGEKVRGILTRIYSQMHNMKVEEMVDFFTNCIETRTSGT